MCGYKLAIYWQNFIYSTGVKISQKVLGGYFFDSRCRATATALHVHALRYYNNLLRFYCLDVPNVQIAIC